MSTDEEELTDWDIFWLWVGVYNVAYMLIPVTVVSYPKRPGLWFLFVFGVRVAVWERAS